MSEVGDAVQVVMLCGRGAMLIGNISLKLAMQFVKLLNTIYLAKWEGSVSLNRLRQIKGDDFVFINVSSEQKEDLAAIENEMKSHGILYARMPDLCGGDAVCHCVFRCRENEGDASRPYSRPEQTYPCRAYQRG